MIRKTITSLIIGFAFSGYLMLVLITNPNQRKMQYRIDKQVLIDSCLLEIIDLQDKKINRLEKRIKSLEE